MGGMKDYELIDLATGIALKAHKGQSRHDGVTPYFLHVEQVSGMFTVPKEKALALLHDSIEDGEKNGVTFEYIRDEFNKVDPNWIFDSDLTYIFYGLKVLTHAKDKTYKEYICGIVYSPYKKLKIADIVCNLCDDPSDYQKEKYRKAMKILLDPAHNVC